MTEYIYCRKHRILKKWNMTGQCIWCFWEEVTMINKDYDTYEFLEGYYKGG